MDDEQLGLRVIRRHALERALRKIIEQAAEVEGSRDPEAVTAMLERALEQAAGMLGQEVDTPGLMAELRSAQAEQMIERRFAENLAALRMMLWTVVELVIHWTDDPEYLARMRERWTGIDAVDGEALLAKFRERTAEWDELDRPEMVYAARAHHALRRLTEVRMDRLDLIDYTGVALVFLDGPRRTFS